MLRNNHSHTPKTSLSVILVVSLLFVPATLAQGTYKTLYAFTGGADGTWPWGGPVFDRAGKSLWYNVVGRGLWLGRNLSTHAELRRKLEKEEPLRLLSTRLSLTRRPRRPARQGMTKPSRLNT